MPETAEYLKSPGQSTEDGPSKRRFFPRKKGRFAKGFVRGMFHPITSTVCLLGVIAALVLPPSGLGIGMCSTLETTGFPCPGCGLTRSVTSIYHGHLDWAWKYNPLGYPVAVVFALLAPLAFLPRRVKIPLKRRLKRIERPLVIAFMVYIIVLFVFGLVRAVLVGINHPEYSWWGKTDIPPFIEQADR